MGEKKLQAGELVYREGDSADNAYVVISGKIELLEMHDSKNMRTGLIEKGQAFGELAVFSPASLRSHSAQAMEATSLESISPEEFQAQVDKCPQQIQPFLKRAFERMKSTRVKVKPSIMDAVSEKDVTKITIAPASEKLMGQFQTIEVVTSRLPFRIGGYPEGGEPNRRDQLHLAIAAHDTPLRVSRQQCEISIEEEGLIITDLGSRFNTKVNGTVLGRGRGLYKAPLKKGPNEIFLGTMDNQYKIIVTC